MAKKILLVDDDKDFLSITTSHIKKSGYDVEIAYNGKECLTKVRSGKPDLILLDVMMPDQNGFDVCKKLKSDKNAKTIPVILMTAHVKDACDMIYNHEDVETEADDYMEKPVNFEKLLKSVSYLLDRNSNFIKNGGIDSSQIAYKKKHDKELKSAFLRKCEQSAETPFSPDNFIVLKTVANGTKYLFRTLRSTDTSLLLEFCNTVSEESIAFPFFQSIKISPQEVIRKVTSVDSSKEMAIGVFIKEKGKEQIIGIGYYALIQKSNKADVSIIISDYWEEKGVGNYLLKIITEIIARRGIAGLEVKVLADNKVMLSLFCESGFKVSHYCLDILQQNSCNVMM